MKFSVLIPAQNARRFFAALEWVGDGHANDLDTEVNRLINKYVEESGVPCDSSGEPIENVINTVEFVYNKGDYGTVPTWRTVHVVEETDKYIKGYENGEFKCFLQSKIVGGKVMEV
jgi:hypothetical protein